MYKVFINEKVICFTNNEQSCNQFEHCLVLNFFSNAYLLFLLPMLDSNNKYNIVIVVDDYELVFKEFKKYFKIIRAAGGVVSNCNNNKLFIYRLDKWDLPKGKIEKNESIEFAAIREIEEECGITDLVIQKQLQDTYHIYTFKNNLILKRTYWFEFTSTFVGELVPQLEEDITSVEWLTDVEIENKVLTNTYASIKELLQTTD